MIDDFNYLLKRIRIFHSTFEFLSRLNGSINHHDGKFLYLYCSVTYDMQSF